MVTTPGNAKWLALREEFQVFQQGQTKPILQDYRRKRWHRTEEFAGWITEQSLPFLSLEQALSLYSASGGKQRKEFKGNGIQEIQESLDFLLFDPLPLEGRFQECAAEGGAYKLAGAGKAFVSYLLCLRDPILFGVWNSNAERTLRKLGMQAEAYKKGPIGVGYLDLLEDLATLRRRLGVADFRVVDEFFYAVIRSAQWSIS